MFARDPCSIEYLINLAYTMLVMVPEFVCTIVGFSMLVKVSDCRDKTETSINLTYYTAIVMLILSAIFFFVLLIIACIYAAAYYSWVSWRSWEE